MGENLASRVVAAPAAMHDVTGQGAAESLQAPMRQLVLGHQDLNQEGLSHEGLSSMVDT